MAGCYAVESNALVLGDTYYFGVPFELRVHSGKLLRINLKDKLEVSAEFCDLDAGGRYVTRPISILAEDRKTAQQKWKIIYAISRRGKYSFCKKVTN